MGLLCSAVCGDGSHAPRGRGSAGVKQCHCSSVGGGGRGASLQRDVRGRRDELSANRCVGGFGMVISFQ